MGKPQVTLTLAGDESKLTQTFGRVGQASKTLADDVGSSSKRMADETTDAYSRVDGAAGETYDKFDALESVGRGTTDTMSGLSEIMSGNVLQGSTDLAGGVAALADGFSGALLPAIKSLSIANLKSAADTARNTAATVAARGASLASAAATRVMAVAQRVLNVAMRANPIGLIITALILLGTGLVLAYKKSETFRNIVNGALASVKLAFRAVVTAAAAVYSWVKTNAPKIGGFFAGVASSIAAPFRAAFNGIRSAWNNTVGGKGFTVPGWVPNIGGKDFRIPYFHTGGIVSGALGSESLAMVRAGERITGGRNGGATTIVLKSDGSRAGKLLIEILRQAIQVQGGDVQVVLGK